ncbi:MAG: DNA polymerase I [Alphaproteobacteria bacterium]|nr:DNA polymerase I [Alphaproteobacteria bacterium]
MADDLSHAKPAATAPVGPGARLYLVDGSGYIFRAYHALPPLTRASDGMPVGAVSGFCNMVWKFLDDMKNGEKPTHLAVIFDRSERTFRNELYPQYKAHRPPAPEDLVPQFALIREATRAFGIPAVEMEGFEADDLIATYARQAAAAGATVKIVSSDKDLMQLVDDGRIELFDPMKQKPLGPAEVIEKFGVPPEKVIEVQALMGDSVDNVPGCPGVGQKTAAELIAAYGDIETLLARADEIKQPKRRQAIIDNADKIRISKQLVTLRDDVPNVEPMETFAVDEPDLAVLLQFLEGMEFRTLTRRVREHAGESHVETPPPPAALADDDPPVDHSAYETVDTLERLTAWMEEARAQGFLAVDTETDSLDSMRARLVGVSLALAPNRACYIPLLHIDPAQASNGDLFGEPTPKESTAPALKQIPFDAAIAALRPVLEDSSILKIGQNIKYDLEIFVRHGIRVAPIDCTMLMSYCLAGGLHGHGMDEQSERLLGHTPIPFKQVAGTGKSQVTFDKVPLDEATKYSAEDADVTLRLWRKLKPRLARENVRTVYETLERPMPWVLAEMEMAGVKVDPDELSRMSGEFAQRMAAYEDEAHKLAGKSFNLGSPKQLGEILFDEMSIPGGRKTKTGAWSTDSDALEEVAALGHELPRVVLDWRQLQKLRSTYTEALRDAINPETKRVHTSFALAATTTGRLSSSDPNLQNIPIRTEEGRRIREAFIAEPGSVLISADYSQIELRLLAHVANIPELKQAFADGLDIHAMTASEMFGVPIQGMDPMVRRQAKAINFGIIYGISAFGLARNLGIEQSEAAAYIKKYFERFPGIRAYMDTQKAFAREHGYVQTLFGRKCWVAGIKSKTPAERAFAERQAINAPLQGAAADIIRRAMIRMPDALKDAGLSATMLLQVHDELVFEAPEKEADAACKRIAEIMQNAPDPAVQIDVPLVVEAKAAANWAAAH